MPTQTTTDYRFVELILPFSLAIDLGTGAPMESFLRATLLAVNLGEKLGLSDSDLSDVYYLSLLRFAGCTASAHIKASAVGDEHAFNQQISVLDYTNPSEVGRVMLRTVTAGRPPLEGLLALANAIGTMMREGHEIFNAHCEVAQRLAARLGLSQTVVTTLGQTFERWDGKKNRASPVGLKGEAIPLAARVVQVAHSVEPLYRIGGLETAVHAVSEWSGHLLDPSVVERFSKHAEELCKSMEGEATWETALEAEPGPRPRLSAEQLAEGIRAMADFVDLQNPYMVGHSTGVARLSRAAAQRLGLPEPEVVTIERAALLHDLGRVSVPVGIWLKRGPLSDGEHERVRLHPYYTERILARSRPLAQYGVLGALHHERLDGSGYHRSLPASLLSPTARILAAADAYQVMTADHPYHSVLSPEQAAMELKRDVRAGRLDGEAVNAVLVAAGQRAPETRTDYVAGLTEREVEVLRLVAHGHTNREIARRLTVSPKTVENHLYNLYGKLNVSTRAAATFFAMQHHLV